MDRSISASSRRGEGRLIRGVGRYNAMISVHCNIVSCGILLTHVLVFYGVGPGWGVDGKEKEIEEIDTEGRRIARLIMIAEGIGIREEYEEALSASCTCEGGLVRIGTRIGIRIKTRNGMH